MVTACGGTSDDATPSSARSAAPASIGASAPVSAAPATPDGPTPTDDPVATDEASTAPATDEPSSTAGTGPAAACAGNDDNRDFFAAVAEAVDWVVYCPVLGSGWFVDAGQYRLAGGGWMEIAYRGPDGARLEFRQGAACSDPGCVPSGEDAGEVAFGDMTGTLVVMDDGLAVVVDPGATPSWTVTGMGLGQEAFEGIAADLVRVEG